MKRYLIVLAFLLCSSPALFACEACYTTGMTDPVGNYVYATKCWAGLTTGFATCLPNPSTCTTTTDSTCTGSGGRGAQHKDPVGGGAAPSGFRGAHAGDCSADVSGTCSGTKLEADSSFLG
jgi:hypothetical protein